MALSVTFFPQTLTANAVWFGCDLNKHDIHGYDLTDAELITNRLAKFEGGVFHPMVLPTMFADFERDRQIDLVRKKLTELRQRLNDLTTTTSNTPIRERLENTASAGSTMKISASSTCMWAMSRFRDLHKKIWKYQQSPSGWTRSKSPTPSSAFEGSDMQETEKSSASEPLDSDAQGAAESRSAALLSSDVSYLKHGLQNWQAQLVKMIEHVDELGNTDFGLTTTADTRTAEYQSKLEALRKTGIRIRARLRDLVDEYDEFIRKCRHMMDMMTLATQIVGSGSEAPATTHSFLFPFVQITHIELTFMGRTGAQ